MILSVNSFNVIFSLFHRRGRGARGEKQIVGWLRQKNKNGKLKFFALAPSLADINSAYFAVSAVNYCYAGIYSVRIGKINLPKSLI